MENKKKIATRESYGNALAEFGEAYPDLVVLDADLAAATRWRNWERNMKIWWSWTPI